MDLTTPVLPATGNHSGTDLVRIKFTRILTGGLLLLLMPEEGQVGIF